MENNNTLCIEDIMEEIRREIKEKNLSSDMLSFEDVPYKKSEEMGNGAGNLNEEAEISLKYINSHYSVQPYKQLCGNPLSVFVKKVIRKLTKFYVEPIVAEQNEFNGHAVKVINAVNNLGKADKDSAQEISDLINRIEVLELNQKNLSIKLELLEKENKSLKEELGKQEAL